MAFSPGTKKAFFFQKHGWHMMRERFVSIKEIERITPPVNIDDYPSHEIRRMVVLFSDVAGAEQYANTHGEEAAESMLRLHQDMVSSSVHSEGGFFVKTVGDAVMAFFLDPKNAVRAAVLVQQRIRSHNNARTRPEERFGVRIGIHFGNGIAEKTDITGDVVTICAKIVHLAEKDEIVISRPLYELVKRLKFVGFEPAGFPRENGALRQLQTHRVNWSETPQIVSELRVLLYLKPVWAISRDLFSDDWDEILNKKGHFWENKIAEKISADKSAALIFDNVSVAIDTANDILNFLIRNDDKNEAYQPASVQVIIDYGPYLKKNVVSIKDLNADWEKIDPGTLHISPLAFRLMENTSAYFVDPLFRLDRTDAFHRLIKKRPAHEDDAILFLYQCNLVRGKNVPCFYCGTRKHQAINCPSKKMREPGRSLEKLGYMPLDEINRIFFLYLTQADIHSESPEISGTHAIAHDAFNELKYVFQLRFFNKIWDTSEEDWERAKTGKAKGRKKGGKVWLAFDCIRICNLSRAETLLNRAMQENPNDYKVFCALGFLFVERTRFREAANYFNRALELAQTKPQAILVLFLLSRLHLLNGDLSLAEKSVRHILLINPRCSEAIFQNIVYRFHEGPEEKALTNLASFLRDYPEYYVNAMIDPDFASFNRVIHPKLQELFDNAKAEAEQVAPMAQREIGYLEKLFGENDSSVREVGAVFEKINELFDTKSYLGYLDVIHYVNLVSAKSKGVVERRKNEIHDTLYEINDRCQHQFAIVDTLSDVALRLNVRGRLADIKNEVEKTNAILRSDAPDRFKTAIQFSEACSEKLSQIEKELGRFGTQTSFRDYLMSFLKWSGLFQSINLAVCVLLYFIHVLLPGVRVSDTLRLGVFLFGVLGGVLLAFVASALKDSEK